GGSVVAAPVRPHGGRLAVAQPSVRADLLEALDVQRDLATEIALHRELAVDDLTDLRDLGLGEVAYADRVVHARLIEHLARVGRSDAEDVAERHVNALL